MLAVDRAPRLLLTAAGVVLIGTAALHATGYGPVVRLVTDAGIPSGWAGGLKALWLIFSGHLVVVGLVLLAAAARPEWAGVPVLALCGLLALIDASVLLTFVGVFPGNILLGAAALMVFGATWLRQAPSAGG